MLDFFSISTIALGLYPIMIIRDWTRQEKHGDLFLLYSYGGEIVEVVVGMDGAHKSRFYFFSNSSAHHFFYKNVKSQ
jgi:hypothetical protein